MFVHIFVFIVLTLIIMKSVENHEKCQEEYKKKSILHMAGVLVNYLTADGKIS